MPVGIPDAPLTFWELLSPFVALDFGAFNPQPPRNLGMVGWVFALGAVGGAIVRRGRAADRSEWAAWLFFPLVFAGGVGAGLTLQWNAIDVLALTLFPLAVTASRMTAWLEAVPRGWGRQLILALLVGLFLIFNSVNFSVLQRRGLIGVLRALGLTRRQLLTMVLVEAAAVGLVAAVVGVAFGAVLGDGCTILDGVAACATGAGNHGQFASCVSHLTNELKRDGVISGKDKGAIQACLR